MSLYNLSVSVIVFALAIISGITPVPKLAGAPTPNNTDSSIFLAIAFINSGLTCSQISTLASFKVLSLIGTIT